MLLFFFSITYTSFLFEGGKESLCEMTCGVPRSRWRCVTTFSFPVCHGADVRSETLPVAIVRQTMIITSAQRPFDYTCKKEKVSETQPA